ncbi:MAG: YeiH family putative sulfate export transporter [Herminiimonas sp.]|nr:YeiH family putative sulfate export transporter [Herminiimonas sp.]
MNPSDSTPFPFFPTTIVRASARRLLPGLVLSALIAACAIMLAQLSWLQDHGLSTLTLAIVLGTIVGNTVFPRLAAICGPGVQVSRQSLLRLGIVLYGLRLTFQDVGQVGLPGVVIDALVLGSTFALSIVLGTRLLKLDRNTAILIGAGSAICGAAAVMAAEPVVRAKSEQVTVAVSTVVVFGSIAIFLYPMLYELNQQWNILGSSAADFGIYIGSTVHEVAQVVAAAKSINQDAANAAIIAKMVRVMMLAPFLILLSVYMGRQVGANAGSAMPKPRLAIPWFAFAFVGVVGINSLSILPRQVISAVTQFDTLLLAMAMAALGLSTHLSAIRRAGPKPLILASFLFCWLIGGGAVINRVVLLSMG